MSDIEIEIDGKPLKAKPNSMVIQVADDAGIYIPRFCYHKHLNVAANCRMCLVEVEKSPKALPACATPVTPGMKVFTRSTKALAAQKAVMEFLLINHPLDCPICDQGGECELQDLSMGYGAGNSYYNEGKRVVKDKDIGPLVETEMTRCIQCTRCVRFGDEVAGLRELGATGRGEHMEIGTYVEHAMKSEVSGNIIDLCPVGALTSKPFRFTARAWELDQHASVAPHDCVGSNLYLHTRNGTVMRAVPRENDTINQTWISDRDRFSYQGLYHADRLAKPAIKVNGQWIETDWAAALEFAVEGLQKVLAEHGPEALGALASPNATLEESYLLQKVMRSLECNNVDHRLRQVDFSDQDSMSAFPGLGCSIADIEQAETILLIGSNIQKEQPVAALRVRKAAQKGATVLALNMVDYDFHFKLTAKEIVSPGNMVSALGELLEAVQQGKQTGLASQLVNGKKTLIILGHQTMNHPHAGLIRQMARVIASQLGATCGMMTEGANTAGAWLAGMVPHRSVAGAKTEHGLHAQAMLDDPRHAYVLLNVEPNLDCANPVAAQKALQQAKFVVALSLFKNAVLEQHADVILPIAPYTETAGTFVNAAGDVQSFKGVATSFGESRPAWKVLRVFGNLLQLDGFDYETADEVRQEVNMLIERLQVPESQVTAVNKQDIARVKSSGMTRVGEIPIYAVDSLVRRGEALQAAQSVVVGDIRSVHLHPETAKQLGVTEGEMVRIKQTEGEACLPVKFDTRLPHDAAWIAGGIVETTGLSELFGSIEIQKI